ncbi:hypothetical protein K0M31_007965 [Melipona bicolor]|uniref:Uncharacterized protein n=1 Tax=Melipona bicolor TaxID=60889 RepID=A0AA40KWA5_9HYME|nr:hypothetical protein K0M31_007965 [Melipona bicolor]
MATAKHYSLEDASRCSAYLQIKRSACYFRRQNTFLRATFLTRMNYVCCVSFTNTGCLLFHGEISANIQLATTTDCFFITESDFSGDNPENRASSGATLMQRKLAIG